MDLQFKSVNIENIGEALPFYNLRHNKTCDSVFLESFIWKEYYHVRFAIWEEKALLWLMESGGKCFSAMPLCREEDLPDAFNAIEQYFNEELGYPLVINLADEYAVKYLNLPEDKYLVEEQVDSKDYLYEGNAMRTLAGKKLHKKKNRVNAFKREYDGRYEYRRLCCSDSHVVWEFLDKWRLQKGDDVEEHLDYEVRGIHDILKNCSDLYVRMGGVFIDGQLEAFSIGSFNPVENMAVIHIEKANPEINGLYQFINQQFLIEEFPDVEWVNREDDMGLEGLKRAKSSYYPADYARKYLVEQLLDGKKRYRWAEQISNTMAGSRLEYLPEDGKGETKRLWHSCFPEDSESFIDYYYSEKTKDNRILVKNDNGLIISMAQLNPYRILVKDRDIASFYIVGVATDSGRRREGHFRDVFMRMLEELNKEQVPFVFLMPADEKIYLPFDFTYICKLPSMVLTDEAQKSLTKVICRDTEEDCETAAAYMEKWLSKRFDMYCRRDAAYVSRLLKELYSEEGQMVFLYDGDKLAGIRADWGINVKEQRLLYAESQYINDNGSKPLIMARLTCPETFLSLFKLRDQEEEFQLRIRINDKMSESVNGCYIWSLSKDGATVLKAENMPAGDYDEGTEEIFFTTPGELVSWLFGFRSLREIWPDMTEELAGLLKRIDTVDKVFIDEIV